MGIVKAWVSNAFVEALPQLMVLVSLSRTS